MVFLFVIGIAIFTLPFLLTALHGTGFGLLITLVVRALCASWAIQTLNRRNSEEMDEPEAAILLDEGVKLENVDFDQAIAKYEELIEKFPNSAESKTARTCVETLKANLKRNPASQ